MRLYYKKPVVTADNKIVIEQVTEGKPEALPNGIKRKEISIIAELYPSLELLEQTMAAAERNYRNLKLQGKKTVFQLEAEKRALRELKAMVDDMKSKPQQAPSESPVEEADRVEDVKKEDAPVKAPPTKKAPAKKPVAKKPPAKKPVAKKPPAKKPAAKKPVAKKPPVKKTTTRKPANKKVDDKPKPPRKTTRKTTKKKEE